MPKRPDLPVYFTKLELENIRSFSERQELKLVNDAGFPARWTLIVGDNGVGKTTLLQCLARMRPVFNDTSDDNDEKGQPLEKFEPELAREESNDVLDALARSGRNVKARLEAYLSDVPLEGPREGREGTIRTWVEIRRARGHFKDWKPGARSSRQVKEPLVLGYGAGRHPSVTNVDKVTTTDPTETESLFKVAAELLDAEELLHQLDYSFLKGQSDAGVRLGNLKKMLSAMLPDIQAPEDIKILARRGSGTPLDQTGIHIKTPSGDVSLGQLSLGYQMVFAWTVDIAWWLLRHYPGSLNPFDEPAIVIVDEIDLHLHPRWQREIREHLTSHFPKVQFIATAHSPVMTQSSLGANLAVVRWLDDHAVIENDPIAIRDWRLDQVLTSDLYGFDSARPPEIEKLQKRRQELVQKEKLSNAEGQELDELDRMVLDLPTAETPEDQKAMEIIRKAAELLPLDNGSS
ncbi:MAG: ATP-binding protein [Nitrospira sp.]|nr:ATP-binding protein [Nitrospira sp.]MCY4132738.1 ATP-binding protein [Nitrospira sp.]